MSSPAGRLMAIKSSGVSVESKTGKATTDRLATFKFDRGDGQAMGADYDPNTRELNLHNEVSMTWRGTDPGTIPMKIETAQLNYNERDAKVYLTPWSKLTRDTLTLNAGPATVTLQNGNLKMVDTTQAKGTDKRPGRNLEYSANQLIVEFNDNNQIQKMTGVDQARVVSNGDTSQTTITSDRVVMDFETTESDSLLQTAVAQGHSIMESKPVIKPGVDPADTRMLKSDTIHTKMRPGGQEIEAVETDGPGAIEFIPNRPEQPHRWMNGDHIWMTYGPKNTIQSFRSDRCHHAHRKAQGEGCQGSARSGAHLEQEHGGDVPAQFVAAGQSGSIGRFSLSGRRTPRQGRSRVARSAEQHHQFDRWRAHVGFHRFGRCRQDRDESDVGRLHRRRACHFHAPARQEEGRFQRRGNAGSEDEPLHARAKKMVSKDNNLDIRYEGDAVLWQGADRLEAETVEIDRDNNLLKAHGHVLSQLLDKVKDDSAPKDGKTGGKADGKAKSDPPAKQKSAASADPASKTATKASLACLLS